jgi:hypothetical protein
LVGDHLLLRDSGPYGIIFMNACVVITVAMVMMLRDFGPYGIFMNVCVCCYNRCHGNTVKDFGPYMKLFQILPPFLTSNLLQLHIRLQIVCC